MKTIKVNTVDGKTNEELMFLGGNDEKFYGGEYYARKSIEE